MSILAPLDIYIYDNAFLTNRYVTLYGQREKTRTESVVKLLNSNLPYIAYGKPHYVGPK